jgi:hypothetical protein
MTRAGRHAAVRADDDLEFHDALDLRAHCLGRVLRCRLLLEHRHPQPGSLLIERRRVIWSRQEPGFGERFSGWVAGRVQLKLRTHSHNDSHFLTCNGRRHELPLPHCCDGAGVDPGRLVQRLRHTHVHDFSIGPDHGFQKDFSSDSSLYSGSRILRLDDLLDIRVHGADRIRAGAKP